MSKLTSSHRNSKTGGSTRGTTQSPWLTWIHYKSPWLEFPDQLEHSMSVSDEHLNRDTWKFYTNGLCADIEGDRVLKKLVAHDHKELMYIHTGCPRSFPFEGRNMSKLSTCGTTRNDLVLTRWYGVHRHWQPSSMCRAEQTIQSSQDRSTNASYIILVIGWHMSDVFTVC